MAIQPGKRERENLWQLLEMARNEDLGSGDVTSSILPHEVHAVGRFVARQPVGGAGFGYDPIFRVAGSARTLAEMEADEKNAISHRGRALRRIMKAVETAFGLKAVDV